MMYWQIGILCYAFKQYDLYGYVSSSMAVSIIIQTAYIYKFFLWETGYFCSMDIQHDRAGYYICYGCLAYLPIVYTMHTLYLTKTQFCCLKSGLSSSLLLGCLVYGAITTVIARDKNFARLMVRPRYGVRLRLSLPWSIQQKTARCAPACF